MEKVVNWIGKQLIKPIGWLIASQRAEFYRKHEILKQEFGPEYYKWFDDLKVRMKKDDERNDRR